MKAFVLRSYGSPDDLVLAEIGKPVPGDGEVLVRVRAASVQPADWHIMRGEPYAARLMGGALGLRRPKLNILGVDLAGQVEAVGAGVTRFGPGDEVFTMRMHGGGFAEYLCVPENELAPKPANLTFEQAAAVPVAGLTALLAVRDHGQLGPGQKVLVNGASGGVGTFAVQLARAFGAEVTGVCSARNVDLVRSLGAAKVIDYTTTDFTRGDQRYDVVLAVSGSQSIRACRRVMTRRGRFVVVGGPAGRWLQPMGLMLATFGTAPFLSQRVSLALVEKIRGADIRENLVALTQLIEQGKVTPVIDRCYPFEEIPAAIRYQEGGHAQGKVVIAMG